MRDILLVGKGLPYVRIYAFTSRLTQQIPPPYAINLKHASNEGISMWRFFAEGSDAGTHKPNLNSGRSEISICMCTWPTLDVFLTVCTQAMNPHQV